MRQLKITQQITNRGSSKSLNSYLTDVTKESKPLTTEEEVELAQKIREGDERALDKLVRANLRFVISVAKQYQGTGLPLDDLIQYGNLGLITAAQRFDETKGFKFISYAVWWIRQSILSGASDSAKTIRLPLNKINVLNKTKKLSADFEQKHERLPTTDELYEMFAEQEIDTELNKDEDNKVSEKIRQEKISKKFNRDKDNRVIHDVLANNYNPSSIDAPVAEDSNDKFSDIMISESGNSAESRLNKEDFETKLRMIFKYLKPREEFVLTHLFGLFGNEVKTLEEISENLELTKERVRQIKDKALRRMRAPGKSKFIKEFV